MRSILSRLFYAISRRAARIAATLDAPADYAPRSAEELAERLNSIGGDW